MKLGCQADQSRKFSKDLKQVLTWMNSMTIILLSLSNLEASNTSNKANAIETSLHASSEKDKPTSKLRELPKSKTQSCFLKTKETRYSKTYFKLLKFKQPLETKPRTKPWGLRVT